MSDKYWENHDSNPINDKEDTNWCNSCQSFEIVDNNLCDVCINENYSRCCGAELTGGAKDLQRCPECKDSL